MDVGSEPRFIKIQRSLIKDGRVFDLDYTPPANRVFVREEMKELGLKVSGFISGLRRHLLLNGLPGTGKTLSARIVCREAEMLCESLKTYYIRCSQADTSFRVVSSILSTFKKKEIRGRSFNEGIKELFELMNENDRNIMILDDVDFLKDYRLLHVLSRTGEEAEAINVPSPCVLLVMISNTPHFLDRLPHSTRSSLFPVVLTFGPYTKEEILQVLKMRAEDGLVKNAVDEDTLELLSHLVAEKAFGDLRVAVLSLGLAADDAARRGDKIREKDVVDAFRQARKEVERFALRKLTKNQLLLLYACILSVRQQHRHGGKKTEMETEAGLEFAEASRVYKLYKNLCHRFGILSPLNYKSFHNHINLLQNLGLVSTSSVRTGKEKTPGKVIEPLVKKYVVAEEMKRKFESCPSLEGKTKTLDDFHTN